MSYSIQSLMLSVALAQLLRAKQVCELLQISKSTMYSWLKVGGRYYNPEFPRPIYLSNGRTPFWRLADLKEFISATGAESLAPGESEAVPLVPKTSKAVTPILKADAAEGGAPTSTPIRPTAFKEVILKGDQKVLMRLRHHTVKVDPSRVSV